MIGDDARLLAELEALEAEEKRRERYNEWCPHKPSVKQAEFLKVTALEALYGGAAGGGKSDALLMSALEYVDRPGYAALILRRTLPDLNLPNAIMSRAKEWLASTPAKWNDRDKKFTFPSGATLTFGFCETANDVYRYQGAELQFIGIDELTQWPPHPYRYLLSRLRRLKGVDIPLRMRAGANPGGIGHEWVKRRFIDEGAEGAFVPARLEDNPHLDAVEYRETLARLDANTRRQLEEGVWVRDASGLVYQPVHRVRNLPPGEWRYLLGIDFGIRDATAYVILAWRENDHTVYVVESFKETGTTVTQAAERVLAYQKQYDFTQVIGDLGGMGKAFGQEFQRRYSIPIEPAQKTNKRGYIGLCNGAIERRELVVVEPTNTALLKELAELPWADETHQKESDGFDNHITDALLYAWRASTAFSQPITQARQTDPLEQIRQATADVWRRYEEERTRVAAERRLDDYDIGSRFDSEDY